MNKQSFLVAVMTLTMLSVIACGVTLLAGAFFVQALGVATAVALPVGFGVLALVGNFVVGRVEGC